MRVLPIVFNWSQWFQNLLYNVFGWPVIRWFRLGHLLDLSTSVASTLIRGFEGVYTGRALESAPRPKVLLKLYEYEGCPFCRIVRETLGTLDLDVIIYPCPVVGSVSQPSRYRPEVEAMGEKLEFPFLVDDNTGVKLHGCGPIKEYLWKTYGGDAQPPRTPHCILPGALSSLTPFFAAIVRPCHGNLRDVSRDADHPLELYGYEGHPQCRRVRETLTSLELPYRLTNLARGSRKRDTFYQEKGSGAGLPYLFDPNTRFYSDCTEKIIDYLRYTYKVKDAPPQAMLL
eukprot:Rmarinus@m.3461